MQVSSLTQLQFLKSLIFFLLVGFHFPVGAHEFNTPVDGISFFSDSQLPQRAMALIAKGFNQYCRNGFPKDIRVEEGTTQVNQVIDPDNESADGINNQLNYLFETRMTVRVFVYKGFYNEYTINSKVLLKDVGLSTESITLTDLNSINATCEQYPGRQPILKF